MYRVCQWIGYGDDYIGVNYSNGEYCELLWLWEHNGNLRNRRSDVDRE
jgi:hypothetical protein